MNSDIPFPLPLILQSHQKGGGIAVFNQNFRLYYQPL